MNDKTSLQEQETPSADLPLSVLLFSTAMSQEVPLSEFARHLGIGTLSLRQFISGQSQRPRGRTLELLANALSMSVGDIRERASQRPARAPRFNEWMKARMEEGRLSRARITRETRISDGALRNYLAGQTLPDTDQAQRLAVTLDVDPLELASVLVADYVVRNGGQTLPVSDDEAEDAEDTDHDERSSDTHTWISVSSAAAGDEEHLLSLWRKLHPQARRATLIYIAGLLVES